MTNQIHTTMKTLTFGCEFEMSVRSQQAVVDALCSVLPGATVGSHYQHGYQLPKVTDASGRSWTLCHDSSIRPSAGHSATCELVTPPLTMDDLDTLQALIRALRAKGCKVNTSCGLHIHVDGAPFVRDLKALRNLVLAVNRKEDLLVAALGVTEGRLNSFCKKQSPAFVRRTAAARSVEQVRSAWYSWDNGSSGSMHSHYDQSRYHWVNLHNLWYRPTMGGHPTVEFRCFEATMHAGEVKAYVLFVLALAAKALTSAKAVGQVQPFNPASAKFDMMAYLTTNLLLNGEEFKVVRTHLTKRLSGNAPRTTRPRPATDSNPTAVAAVNE